MTETVRLTSDNQITLPEDVRESLGLSVGDEVDFVRNAAGRFEIRTKKLTFADLRGIVKLERPITVAELDQWIADAREAGYREENE